jgi:multiple sugar transport system substrate-binding protein
MVACAALVLAACSSTSSSSGGGGGAADAGKDSRGPITYVQGKDNSGTIRPIIDKWNAAHPDQIVTLKEQTDQADQQHDDLVQHFQAQDPGYDTVSVDVVWTAEFAAKGWLQPLTDTLAVPTGDMLPPTVKAATYNNTLYAAPTTSDAGLLFYRSDLVPTPPATWDEMIADCPIAQQNGMGCYAGQFFKYEGLTVNASEAINTAGGEIVGPDGKTPTVDSPESATGLALLADNYKNGNIPKEAITFKEEDSRIAFEAGKLLFLRNWPYVYKLASTDASSQVIGKFAVAPLPGITSAKPGASSLGGHSTAISVYSKNKATAADFLKYLTTAETQSFYLTQGSQAPVLTALYSDPSLIAQFPYLPTLKISIENAIPRPVTPFYPAVTKAIQDNSYEAIQGTKTVQQALTDMQAAIASAASGG